MADPSTPPPQGILHYLAPTHPVYNNIVQAITTVSHWKVIDGFYHVPLCPEARDNLQPDTPALLQEAWGKQCGACPDPLAHLLPGHAFEVANVALALWEARTLPVDHYTLHTSTQLETVLSNTLEYGDAYSEGGSEFAAASCAEATLYLEEVLAGELTRDPLHHLHQYAAVENVRGAQEDFRASRSEQEDRNSRRRASAREHWVIQTLDPRRDGLTASLGMSYTFVGDEDVAFYRNICKEFDQELQEGLQDQEKILIAYPDNWRSVLDPPVQELLLRLGTNENHWNYLLGTRPIWHYLQQEFNTRAYALGVVEDSDTPAILETARALIRNAECSELQGFGQALAAARMLNP